MRQIKCPSCGSPLSINHSSSIIKCDYCGSTSYDEGGNLEDRAEAVANALWESIQRSAKIDSSVAEPNTDRKTLLVALESVAAERKRLESQLDELKRERWILRRPKDFMKRFLVFAAVLMTISVGLAGALWLADNAGMSAEWLLSILLAVISVGFVISYFYLVKRNPAFQEYMQDMKAVSGRISELNEEAHSIRSRL